MSDQNLGILALTWVFTPRLGLLYWTKWESGNVSIISSINQSKTVLAQKKSPGLYRLGNV